MPSHVILKILIPYSRFSRVDRTDLEHVPARVFFKLSCLRFKQHGLSESEHFGLSVCEGEEAINKPIADKAIN